MDSIERLNWTFAIIKQLLKPCPICGETEKISLKNNQNKEIIECLECNFKIEKKFNIKTESVASFWNRFNEKDSLKNFKPKVAEHGK